MNMDHSVYWSGAIFPAVVLVVLAVAARIHQKSWLAPGAFFLLAWSVYVWLPLLGAPHYYVWPNTVWLIVFSGAVFNVGCLLGLFGGGKGVSGKGNVCLPATYPVIICTFVGMIGVLLMFNASGFGLGRLKNVDELAEMSGQLSVMRYHEGYDMPQSARILISFAFAGCAFGGRLFVTSNNRVTRLLSLLPFVPLLVVTLSMTTRMTTLTGIIFWLGGFLAMNAKRFGWNAKLFTAGRVMLAAIVIPALVVLAVFVQMLRADEVSTEKISESYERAATVFFGHLGAFSYWMETAEPDSAGLGKYTVAGVYDFFGIKAREQGIFLEDVEVAEGQFTNVYTALRCLIEDFTYPGLFVVLFVVGLLSGLVYRKAVAGSEIGVALLVVFYVFTLWCHVTSIFNYNSVLLACGLLIVYAVRAGIHKQMAVQKSIEACVESGEKALSHVSSGATD